MRLQPGLRPKTTNNAENVGLNYGLRGARKAASGSDGSGSRSPCAERGSRSSSADRPVEKGCWIVEMCPIAAAEFTNVIIVVKSMACVHGPPRTSGKNALQHARRSTLALMRATKFSA